MSDSLAAPVIAGCAIIISATLFLIPSIVVQATATPAPIFEPLDHVYNLAVEGQSYPIRYGFFHEGNGTAVLEKMTADYESKSLHIMINDNSTTIEKRLFIIELPRNVINSNTTEPAAGCTSTFTPSTPPSWVQEHDLAYTVGVSVQTSEDTIADYSGTTQEECGQNTRTLSIEYPSGQSFIIIRGTSMIPEFGSTLVIAAASLVTMTVLARRYKMA